MLYNRSCLVHHARMMDILIIIRLFNADFSLFIDAVSATTLRRSTSILCVIVGTILLIGSQCRCLTHSFNILGNFRCAYILLLILVSLELKLYCLVFCLLLWQLSIKSKFFTLLCSKIQVAYLVHEQSMIILALVPLKDLLDFLFIRIFNNALVLLCVVKVHHRRLSLNTFIVPRQQFAMRLHKDLLLHQARSVGPAFLTWSVLVSRGFEPHHELSLKLFLLKQELILPYLLIDFCLQIIFII